MCCNPDLRYMLMTIGLTVGQYEKNWVFLSEKEKHRECLLIGPNISKSLQNVAIKPVLHMHRN